MYEDLIFPGVKNIYDYLLFYSNHSDDSTFSAKGNVKIWDDFEKATKTVRFFYGCTGGKLIDIGDGSITNIFRMPFVKINIQESSFLELVIDDELHTFAQREDVVKFTKFVNEYNAFIDRIIKNGIQECFSLSEELYTSVISVPTQNFINMLPQEVFTDYQVYKAVVRQISFRESLFSKYIDFDKNEIQQAYKLIHNGSNEQIFAQIHDMFIMFANAISEQKRIPEYVLALTSYLLIRKGAIDWFSEQWRMNFDDATSFTNSEEYIELCVRKNILTASDPVAVSILTYFLMSMNTSDEEFYVCFSRVYEMVSQTEARKRQESFNKRLFTPINQNNKNQVTLQDVDFMNGDEFEMLICMLFQKMGYRSFITKHSGDQGIDVIAENENHKIGIQAKCYSSSVGNGAIQGAVAGKAYYGCN